jgi:hypothetical protein
MKAIKFSIILFVAIFGMIFISIFMNNTTDLLFALLGGSIVGAAFSMAGTIKYGASLGLSIFMVSVIASGVLWFLSAIVVLILTISLYSTTAMIFDLVIGILGAITMASIKFEKAGKVNLMEHQ